MAMTPEQQREFDEIREMMQYIIAARKTILSKNVIRGKIEHGVIHGKIPCPKCGADLLYTRSPVNNHVHGKCTTEGCLSWME